ncbi:MAG: hypothetical protein K8M05_31400 [Deltaproteobacteria bacterium]|nr:hypothetical protein [Kofleriaceae bacterium]
MAALRSYVALQNGWLAGAAMLAAAVTACSSSDMARCDDHADCASGFCRADHTCAPDDDVDAAPGTDGGDPGIDASVGCVPDHDGTLTRDELVMAAGQMARFRVATDVPVDTAGTQGAGGARAWTFTAAASGDRDLELTLVAPAGQWWADTFPTASYATRLSAEASLLGVMRLDASGVALLGVVSPEAGLSRTELTYDPAVPIIPTPLAPSASWNVTSTVSGLASGVAAFYTERYESRVDAVGEAATPFGTFPVRRIAVDLTRTVGAAVSTRRSFAFVSECYGTVATVASQDYESGSEFTDAAELWRLQP